MKFRFTLFLGLLLFGFSAFAQRSLWGSTSSGFSDNKGAIFKTNDDGTGYAVKYNFVTDFPGSSPQNTLTLANGKLYGVTYGGGANDLGVLFEYDPVANTYTRKFNFSSTDGTNPQSGLLLASNALLYGMTKSGGANGFGVLFEYDPVNDVFTKTIDFTSGTGTNPVGNLMQAANGKLYGMTSAGGANGGGTLFEYAITGTGTPNKMFDFSAGSSPFGDLVEASDGNLYGMTQFGGANSVGVLFKYTPGLTSIVIKIDFATTNGAYPYGSLILAANGKLYGMTSFGGTNGQGILFDYNVSTGILTKQIDFNNSTNGAAPLSKLFQASNGFLYGTTFNGGATNEGILFEYHIVGNILSKVVDFSATSVGANPNTSVIQAADGLLYGITPSGGPAGNGTLFSYNPVTALIQKKVDFSNSTNGSNPQAGLVMAPNGKLYGMASNGGNNLQGVLYEFDPVGEVYAKKVDFSYPSSGGSPSGSLVLANNGNMYGLTPFGGTLGDGVLFEYVPGSTSVTVKVNFSNSTSGRNPYGSLVLASDGLLYGMTRYGGPSDQGVLFSYNPTNGAYASKFTFPVTSNGINPAGSLIQAANGKLYGTTNGGGANTAGTIFEYDIATNVYTKKIDFNSTNGSGPYGDLVQATNGKLYGMTNGGGANSYGVIFEYDPILPSPVVKYDFNIASSGAYPYGNLTETTTGNLFGANSTGGALSGGVYFKYNITGSSFTNIIDLGGTNGSSPQYGSLLLVPAKLNQTVTFGALPNKSPTDPPFNLTANASSGLVVTYSSSDPSIASISGNTVTPHQFGTVTISASQWGNDVYTYAQDVRQTLVIGLSSQTITFAPLPAKIYGDSPFGLTATSSSGLPVAYSSSDPTIASISASLVTIHKGGTVTITASQGGDVNYNPAPNVPQSLTINKANQTIAFNLPASATFGDSPITFPVFGATSDSGLPVAFTSSVPTTASISGPIATITILKAGSVTVTASQPGDGNYNAAVPFLKTLAIAKKSQMINFTALPLKSMGDPAFAPATADSNLPVSYIITGIPGVATGGSAITIVGVGVTQITARQLGNANYLAAADVPQPLTVQKGNQTITFGALAAKVIGDPPFNLTATASSGLVVTYSSTDPTTASISGAQVTILKVGTVTITASQIGNASFNPATNAPQSLVINNKANQTITFGPLAAKVMGDPPFNLTATASSGLVVTYSSSDPTTASVSGTQVTILKVGTVMITASQAGDPSFNPATNAPQSLVINNKANQTITFGPLAAKVMGDPPFNLTATASSGLVVTYTSSDPTTASISGTQVTILKVGTVTITASQAGNGSFNPAPDAQQSLVINKVSQTITFGPLAPKVMGDPPFNLTATASSGLAVTYSSSDPTTASISGTQVTILKVGTVTITASQAGDASFNPATDAPQSLVINNKANQTITFGPLAAKVMGDPPFNLTATASSGLVVTYSSSDPTTASVSGTQVTILKVGTVMITASQAGDPSFNPATNAPQSLVINNKANQTITFGPLAAKVMGDPPFNLTATASSGLVVTYTSSDPTTASISGTQVTILKVGTVTITASQTGDGSFNPAPDVPQSLVINKINQTIIFPSPAIPTEGGPDFTLSGSSSSGLPLTYVAVTTTKLTINGNIATPLKAGLATISARQNGNASYNAGTPVDQTFCIKPAEPTITVTKTNPAAPILLSSSAVGNSWLLNGALIAGANGNVFTATVAGSYTVFVTVEGCAGNVSASQAIIITGDLHVQPKEVNVYPNPAKDKLFVDLSEFEPSPVDLKILDLTGRYVHQQLATGGSSVSMNIADHVSGMYVLVVSQGSKMVRIKYIKD